MPNGVYSIRVTGGGPFRDVTIPNVQIAGQNVKLDVTPESSPPPSPVGGGGTSPLSPAEIRALDVSGDGRITPRDALRVLNYLIEGRTDYDRSQDVTGDGVISPRDALNVVNYLNAYGSETVVPIEETLAYFPSVDLPTDAARPKPGRPSAGAPEASFGERRDPHLRRWFPVISLAAVDPVAVDALFSSV